MMPEAVIACVAMCCAIFSAVSPKSKEALIAELTGLNP